ncbi:MAG TPA: type III polyketide synthase [Chryseosolibacter sp.]|nr:type III polyketide synthase [Chryseosolibacter sp.]
MSYITSIATANPPHRISQEIIAEFMLRAMEFQNGESRKLKAIFKGTGIRYRHSVLADYGQTQNFSFFPNEFSSPFPTTKQRLELFRLHALPLSIQAVNKALADRGLDAKEMTHLVVASCTGMYAPGLDIDLIRHVGLKSTVDRTAINFMGCYAAFNAIKVADAFCRSNLQAKVLIVATELCSIHFQRMATDDNLLANALFADGSAAVIVEGKEKSGLCLEVDGFFNDIYPEASNDMAWTIGDLGFEMKLSAYVPDVIQKGIKRLTDSLLATIDKKFSDVKHFAIHPGGRRILEVIEKELGIRREQNSAAYHVLENFGNMSSPTVLFVLDALVRELQISSVDERILSFAFGPGLTMESMMLKIKSL